MKAQKTTLPNTTEIAEKWYIVDADGQVTGRVASRVAKLVRGKLTATYAPHINPKVHVVIINADKVVFTGNKLKNKNYYWHSGWRTGIKSATAEEMLDKKPTEVLRKAIYGMLPKRALGSKLNKNIHIYTGTEHPHEAQQPETINIKTRNAIA